MSLPLKIEASKKGPILAAKNCVIISPSFFNGMSGSIYNSAACSLRSSKDDIFFGGTLNVLSHFHD